MKAPPLAALVAPLALLCAPSLTGCGGRSGAATLGAAPPAAPAVAVRDLKPSAAPVVVRGRMVEKCPVAGCWFVLQDGTGRVRVDTKAAGFVITEVPLNADVTVAGAFRKPGEGGGEPTVVATGVRY